MSLILLKSTFINPLPTPNWANLNHSAIQKEIWEFIWLIVTYSDILGFFQKEPNRVKSLI